MLKEIKVKKTSDPQNGYESKEQLYNDVKQHQEDVCKVMSILSDELKCRGETHDWTKIEFFDEFSKDTLERLTTPEFKDRDWYNIHCTYERHHLNTKAPSDVDLIDVIEMIADCIVSGATRNTFNPYFLILKDSSLLNKAYWNTVRKLKDQIIVVE